MAVLQTQLYFHSPKGLSRILQVGTGATALINAADQILAQYEGNRVALYAADSQRSIVHTTDPGTCSLRYTAYGFDRHDGRMPTVHYTGQHKDSVTGHYLLGEGYRAYNPAQMRFNSPDSLSPFGLGGINAYGYCGGDPVNRSDPSGHVFLRRSNSLPSLMRFPEKPTVSLHRTRSLRRVSLTPNELAAASTGANAVMIVGKSAPAFAYDIISVKGSHYGEVTRYLGRNTPEWLKTFETRHTFAEADSTFTLGVKVSLQRDMDRLAFSIQNDPKSPFAFMEFMARNRLKRTQVEIENLDLRMTAIRMQPQRSWLHRRTVP